MITRIMIVHVHATSADEVRSNTRLLGYPIRRQGHKPVLYRPFYENVPVLELTMFEMESSFFFLQRFVEARRSLIICKNIFLLTKNT